MKFQNNDQVVALVDRGNVKKDSIGYIVCEFTNPNEAYDVEFWNDVDDIPYAYETFLPSELENKK